MFLNHFKNFYPGVGRDRLIEVAARFRIVASLEYLLVNSSVKRNQESLLRSRQIAWALFDDLVITVEVANVAFQACVRRGGRSYAQEESEAHSPQDRPSPAGSGSCEERSAEQPEFTKFTAELQVCDGAIHHLVLFRAATRSESTSGAEISALSGVAPGDVRWERTHVGA
jgi:hypothetical protein